MSELTELLHRVQAGDEGAREALFAAAYSDLERLARARLRDGGRNTLLDTRSLVHESYLRYLQGGELRAEDRRAFFGYASQVMRSVVVTCARERAAQKRGSGWRPLAAYSRMSARSVSTDFSWSRAISAIACAGESVIRTDKARIVAIQTKALSDQPCRHPGESRDLMQECTTHETPAFAGVTVNLQG